MSFWESRLGAFTAFALAVTVLAVGVTGVRVYLATHPPRQPVEQFDFDALLMRVQQVQFSAADGVKLDGWMIVGQSDRPPILLCHDLGSSKAELINLAIALHNKGFSVLTFDFRGHGASQASTSTLGLQEKRDVLGALDFVAERWEDVRHVGIYGVGMGAHAAVLAAGERDSVRVLVLDGLYPDISYPLARRVFADWKPGVRSLSFLSNGLFSLMTGTRVTNHRAEDSLRTLTGRDVLLLAPAGDAVLTSGMQRMVGSIPQQPDVDGNLVVLPATQVQGLYGQDLGLHVSQVTAFFESRMAAAEQRVAQRAVGE